MVVRFGPKRVYLHIHSDMNFLKIPKQYFRPSPAAPLPSPETDLPGQSQTPGSPSVSESERATPHLEYGILAATWNAMSLASPAHSAALPSQDPSRILRTNENVVAGLAGTHEILSVMSDLGGVVDIPPVNIIKASLSVVRFILMRVLVRVIPLLALNMVLASLLNDLPDIEFFEKSRRFRETCCSLRARLARSSSSIPGHERGRPKLFCRSINNGSRTVSTIL
jgi:hypothetical protein